MASIPKEILEIYEENKTKKLVLFRVEKYNNQTFKIVEQKIKIELNQNGICFKLPEKFSSKVKYMTEDELAAVASKWCKNKLNMILLDEQYAYYTLLSYMGVDFAFIAEEDEGDYMHLDTCTDDEFIDSLFTSKVRGVFKSLFGKDNV